MRLEEDLLDEEDSSIAMVGILIEFGFWPCVLVCFLAVRRAIIDNRSCVPSIDSMRVL